MRLGLEGKFMRRARKANQVVAAGPNMAGTGDQRGGIVGRW